MRGPRVRTLVAAVVLLGLVGCASVPRGTAQRPPGLADGTLGTLEWRGDARGPLGALGPRAAIHAFLRADGTARIELRYRPADRPPVHEVLIWTDETAILFDRIGGRYTDLGELPGRVEALGAAFQVFDATWLLTGRRVAVPAEVAWTRRDDEWRGRTADRGWRRGAFEPVTWTELVWRDGETIRTLRASVEAYSGEESWPRVLRLEGAGLKAPIVLEARSVRFHAAQGDSILDPLWDPVAR